MNKRQGWLAALVYQTRSVSDNVWHMECDCKGEQDDTSFECIRLAKLKLLEAERLLHDARIAEQLAVHRKQ